MAENRPPIPAKDGSKAVVGENISKYRCDQGLTGKELASRAGITPSLLSQIERALVNPSLMTLQSISDALAVPIHDLFLPAIDNNDEFIRRGPPADQIPLTKKKKPEVHVVNLSPGSNYSVKMMLMIMAPNSSSGEKMRSHKGEEITYVMSGAVVSYSAKGKNQLTAGDSIKIMSHERHRWENQSKAPAYLIMVVSGNSK